MTIRMMTQAQAAMNALQQKLDSVGHNLANSNTHGYKTRNVEFQSLLKQHIDNLTDPANNEGRQTPLGIRVGTGARVGSTNSHFGIGSMQTTDRPLDTMLLEENHFYQIQVDNNGILETRYTRAGNFYVTPIANGNVRLVTSDGNAVLSSNGVIEFADGFDQIDINERGELLVTYGDRTVNIGQLDIVEITRPGLLQAVGENNFRLPNLGELGFDQNEIVRTTDGNLNLVQNKALEMSNVQIQDEIVEMLNAQRAYQLNARSISTADQMQGLVNQLR